jgi:3-hydroxyacyl-CoA dehydrogenase
MSHNIHTVAVIGAGVIGRSFTALFLAQGFKVLVFVSEPTPTSMKKLDDYLHDVWPTIEKQESASIKNYEILSRVNDLETRLKECDFIQEVHILQEPESRWFPSIMKYESSYHE